jgi:hypothetical protein
MFQDLVIKVEKTTKDYIEIIIFHVQNNGSLNQIPFWVTEPALRWLLHRSTWIPVLQPDAQTLRTWTSPPDPRENLEAGPMAAAH